MDADNSPVRENAEDGDKVDEALLQKDSTGSVSVLPALSIEDKSPRWIQSRVLIAVFVLFVFGLIMLIVGIIFITKAPECEHDSEQARFAEMCKASREGKDSGLYELLGKLESSFFEMFPNKIAYKRPVTVEEIKQKYKAHDPSPENKKRVTDRARKLLKELESLKVDPMKLTPRESKALAQALFTVKYIFGHPFDTNYYAGDYMLGPNLWCAWQPICLVGYDASYTLRYFKPSTVKDMETLRDKLAEINATFAQYLKNIRNGVEAGMVRTVEECKAGIDGLTEAYKKIAFKGEQGVYEMGSMSQILKPEFLANIINSTKEAKLWQSKYGKTVNQSLRMYVLDFVGRPINDLFSYLRTEHIQHCVPSNVSSGLATLPLSYVYVNGTPDKSRPTTKKLPTGEALDGKRTYEMNVGYFTTNDYTPDQIYALGYSMLNKLYPEVLRIARTVSGSADNNTAKRIFIEKLNSSEMYYNQEPFPVNESDENAFKVCSNVKEAMKFCPKRWAAMQKWFVKAMSINSLLDPKTVGMFHFTGPKSTTPNCPIRVAPDFSPSASASYSTAGADCQTNCEYNIPFFGRRFGPTWEEMSTCAHEARPGHHTQAQGLEEHLRDKCGGVIGWIDSIDGYSAFGEGWALYAENPLIGSDTNVYDGRPLDKYGMLKWQVWRALRLIVDSGLHYKGLTRAQALGLFADYAWDTSAFAQLEVTRYQSVSGQATSYMVGQQQIVKLRAYAEKELGKKFNLKDFHYQLLSQGSSPLSHLKNSIYRYVSCMKDDTLSGCDNILNPTKVNGEPPEDEGVRGDLEYRHNPPRPYRRNMYF